MFSPECRFRRSAGRLSSTCRLVGAYVYHRGTTAAVAINFVARIGRKRPDPVYDEGRQRFIVDDEFPVQSHSRFTFSADRQ